MFLVYIQLQTMYEYESGYKVKDVMLMTFFLFFNKQAAELVRWRNIFSFIHIITLSLSLIVDPRLVSSNCQNMYVKLKSIITTI
jgi:hypothetical protein